MVKASDYYKYPTKTKVLKRKAKNGTIKNVPSYKLKSTKRGLKARDYFYLILVLMISAGILNRITVTISNFQPVKDVQARVQASIAPSPNTKFLTLVTPTPTPQIKYVEKKDSRAIKLREYLKAEGKKYNVDSPLLPYADLIVAEADKWDIGWTQLISIARKESGFCHETKPGSHNCWGIGGTNFYFFSSYEESIKFTSKLLGEHYKWNQNKAIQQKYCPDFECASNWTDQVTQTTKEILAINE